MNMENNEITISQAQNLYEHSKIKLSNAKREFLQALVDECYNHAVYFAKHLEQELEIGEKWDYNGKFGDMPVYRVIAPVIPITPKSPAVHLTPEIRVEVIDKNGKLKQIDRPITAFKEHIDLDKINPKEYEF